MQIAIDHVKANCYSLSNETSPAHPALAGTKGITMGMYNESFGRNVTDILVQATRVVRGPIPAQVRAELRAAVKAGVLGHLKRDGLKPEIFYHPDHKHGAIQRQKDEAAYSIKCIAGVMLTGSERAEATMTNLAGAA
jgi:hypothetical protein